MAKKSSEFLKALGRYFEISKAVLNAVLDQGGTDDDLARILSDAELRREIARLIVMKPAKSEFPSAAIAREYGYTVVEDVAPTLDPDADLEFVSFLEPGESVVSGETMRKRAVALKANLGLADLKFLLEHQDKIPAEFRGTKYLAFPGTVLRSPHGCLFVACLYWDVGRWVVDFDRVADDWFVVDLLPRCK